MKEFIKELFLGWYYCLKNDHNWKNDKMSFYRRECIRCHRKEYFSIREKIWYG